MTERAADFVASIGACGNPSYSFAVDEMHYLGITAMRATDYDANVLPQYVAAGKAGIKLDLITVIAPQIPINLADEMSYIDAVAPYVASVEGPNEVNTTQYTYNGLTGAAAAIAFQKDLYAAVHNDPKLAGVKVLPFSLSVGGSLSGFGDVSAYADEGNVHGYAGQGVPPYYMLSYAVSSVTTVTGKPVVMSETGNYTLNDGNSGVTQDVQAKWEMDTLLENAKAGVAATYLYRLDDFPGAATSTDPEYHYGLFNADGTPKQAATDIHNLTTILADNGANAASFTPGTLSYSVTGLHPDYGFQTLFAKSNGSYDLAFWSEPQFYNAATGIAASVTPSAVRVTLGGGLYDVDVYDPVVGTAPIAHYHGVASIGLAITTDPIIAEITPIKSLLTPLPTPVTTGTSPDKTPPTLTASESISGLTNATSVTVSGMVSDAQSSVARVEVYDTKSGHQIDLGAATIGSDGRWTFGAIGLANGTHQFAAAATDFAGNTTGQVSAGSNVTVDTVAPQPMIKTITGIPYGGVVLSGVSEANSIVTVADTVGGKTMSLGSVATSPTGVWQLQTNAPLNTSTINSFSATAQDLAGNIGATSGMLFLASTGVDKLAGTPGVSDVFAIMSFHGSDVINGFQPASVTGAAHDYIDFSGRGISSFGQVQSLMSGTSSAIINIGSGKIITLADVAPTSLTASDFRYS